MALALARLLYSNTRHLSFVVSFSLPASHSRPVLPFFPLTFPHLHTPTHAYACYTHTLFVFFPVLSLYSVCAKISTTPLTLFRID